MGFSCKNFFIILYLVIYITSSFAMNVNDPDLPCKRGSLGLAAQKGDSPYELFILQKNDVAPGDSGVEILLMAPVTAPPFVGFILEVLWGYDAVGKFNPDNSDATAVAKDCSGMVRNIMTHKNLTPKRRVSIEWIAPLNGEYLPTITWFQSEDVYWYNQTGTGKRTIKVKSSGAQRHLPWTPPFALGEVSSESSRNSSLPVQQASESIPEEKHVISSEVPKELRKDVTSKVLIYSKGSSGEQEMDSTAQKIPQSL